MHLSHLLVFILMLATALVLLTGIVVMMRGGPLNDKYGNKLMVARVTLQGLTILVIGLMLLAK